MKRQIIVVMAVGLTIAACSDDRRRATSSDDAPKPSAWVQPPHIDGLRRDGGAILVRGAAGPGARVVLRGADGAAVAATADAAGRFELRLPPLDGDVLLRPEVQVGEDAAVSPETLVVIRGGAGPVALVAAGQPTVRLDAHGVLDAVDFDGKTLAASGHAPNGPPTVSIDGAKARVSSVGGEQWRALSADSGTQSVDVGGRVFTLPDMDGGASFSVERAGAGWKLTLPIAPQGRQTTWLPDIQP